jgi:uncharacterized protein YdcH (DUF465 family)
LDEFVVLQFFASIFALKRQKYMTLKEKKEIAKLLYLKDNKSGTEIAEFVGVSVQTVSNWTTKGGWKKLKASYIATKDQQLMRMYNQLTELNDAIANKEEGKRYPDSKEADAMNKIAAAIRHLETETSISEVIDVSIKFSNWLREQDPKVALEYIGYQDDFIKHLMRK